MEENRNGQVRWGRMPPSVQGGNKGILLVTQDFVFFIFGVTHHICAYMHRVWNYRTQYPQPLMASLVRASGGECFCSCSRRNSHGGFTFACYFSCPSKLFERDLARNGKNKLCISGSYSMTSWDKASTVAFDSLLAIFKRLASGDGDLQKIIGIAWKVRGNLNTVTIYCRVTCMWKTGLLCRPRSFVMKNALGSLLLL